MREGKITSKDWLREYGKKHSALYRFIVYVFGPTYLFGTGPERFLDRHFHQAGVCKLINIGSGPTRLRSDVINVDITNYAEVNVIASATKLPFPESSVDGVVCDNVLEHVDEPQLAVREMYRVMKSGAVGYISTPFLYPFHASPHDYQRWTAAGLEYLFKDFSDVQVEVRSGLFSALNTWLCYVLPSFLSLGSDRAYWLLVNLSLFIFFPVKFLDVFVNQLPFARHTAAVFYCIIKK